MLYLCQYKHDLQKTPENNEIYTQVKVVSRARMYKQATKISSREKKANTIKNVHHC
jgi:hypothetical protein